MAQEKKIWAIPFISVFILVTGFSIALQGQLVANNINWAVVLGANTLLFLFSLVNIYFQKKNINNPNRSVVIRGVMAGTFLKLMGLAAAALIYLVAAGPARSVNAVFIGMGLYIVYTWLEVRISLRLKPKS
ncbi:MAG: hypothetical protein Q8K66_06095 [Sediminibacterium sp.]|nr:hypothetical protein [Sediminibacterium sp.]